MQLLTDMASGFIAREARGVSGSGNEIVGWGFNAQGQERAFRWTSTAGFQDLGTLGGDTSRARGISYDGTVVVGVARNAAGQDRAFRWTAIGGMQDLGVLPGGGASFANAVDVDGATVVGLAYDSAGNWNAFHWRADYGMQRLHPGGGGSEAQGIAGGHIVGWATASLLPLQINACRWVGPFSRVDGTLGGIFAESTGVSLNGTVVGCAWNVSGEQRAFRWTHVAGIDLLDPHTHMLLGNATGAVFGIQHPEHAISWDRASAAAIEGTVSGVACDGVSRLVVRWPVPGPGAVDFELLDELGGEQVGLIGAFGTIPSAAFVTEVEVQEINGRHVAFATYAPPIDFSRSSADESLASRTVTLKATFRPLSGPIVEREDPIVLVRPPVALIHGLWSNATAWQLGLDGDPRFCVHPANYSGTADQPFSTNVSAGVVREAVRAAVQKQRDLGYACSQADVIGHSMGGLLARLHAANAGGDYYRYENLGQGDIHKLITLYTPHQGSGWGCVVENLLAWSQDQQWHSWLTSGADRVNMCLDCGAVSDLKPTSEAILGLPAAAVPSHAIVGVGGPEIVSLAEGRRVPLAEQFVLTLAWVMERATGRPWLSEVVGGDAHDVIVPEASAAGGLSGLHTTDVSFALSGSALITTGVHTGAVKEEWISESLLIPLLNARLDSGLFASGFAANSDVPVPLICSRAEPSAPPVFHPTGSLTIESPAPGQGVPAGTTINVQITPGGGFNGSHVRVTTTFGAGSNDSDPYNVSIDVPPDAIGPMDISAIALDDEGRLVFSDDVVVTVTTDAELLGITATPSELTLSATNRIAQIHVLGTYSDGITRNLTSGATGTMYEWWSTDVATVSESGLIEAFDFSAERMDHVLVVNGQHQAWVQVRIEHSPCSADFDQSGTVAVPDIFAFLATWFAGDARADFDGVNGIAVPDIFAFLSAWFAGCP
jgi:probable HAF family extracellular repeat protein